MVAIAIIAWILMFMVLIILHELWHFTAARKSWVKVLEFGIWIPPKICKLWKDKKGTEYTANAIPLGWFCSLKWEDPSNPEEFNAPDSFMSAKFWKKIVILLWWVTANFLVAWVLFTVIFTAWTQPLSILPENSIKWESHSLLMPTYSYLQELWLMEWEESEVPLIVTSTISGYLVDDLWIQEWDQITAVNWLAVNSRNLWQTLKDSIWKEITIEYTRDWETLQWSATCPIDSCILWITYASSKSLELQPIKYPFHKAMWMWLKEIWAEWKLTFSSLWTVLKKAFSADKTQRQDSLNSLSGPVWVIVVLKELMYSGDWTVYLAFAWMISLALAIFNILPIPALDGWRTLSVIIQKVFGLKKEKYFTIEWYVNTVFFIILMWLWILIIYNDFKVRVWIDLLYPIKWLIQSIWW